MIENLKTDIIYYCTETDFEMEFNLCGCCRMRLLTNKTDNRNGFAENLSKVVARSQIVILCGSLFGDRNLIDTVSALTDIETEIVDNNRYGIESNDEIKVLKGSTPLITSDKIFGGCIIENNSQTIIILTESKPIRKQLMNELIHSYISEVSVLLASQPENSDNVSIGDDIEVEQNAVAQPEVAPIGVDDILVDENSETTKETNENFEDVIEESNEEVFEDNKEETVEPVKAVIEEVKEHETISQKEEPKPEKPAVPVVTDDAFNFIEIDSDNDTNEEEEPENDETPKEEFSDLYITSSELPTEEKEKPKNKFKGAIITLLAVIGVIILALVYLIVLKPIISGENLSEYINNLFTNDVSSNLVVNLLR